MSRKFFAALTISAATLLPLASMVGCTDGGAAPDTAAPSESEDPQYPDDFDPATAGDEAEEAAPAENTTTN